MEITCPGCSKKYKVDENLLSNGPRKVKCRNCGNLFLAKKEDDGAMTESEEMRGLQLDLNFQEPAQSSSEGTVRISRDQIEASMRKKEEDISTPGIELNLGDSGGSPFSVSNAPGLSAEKKEQNSNGAAYNVRVDGQEYTGLSMDEMKQWIDEDRLLENDEVSRTGSSLWVKAEAVPDLSRLFRLHVYQQRKQFDETDNPYVRFREKQSAEGTGDGKSFLGRLFSKFTRS